MRGKWETQHVYNIRIYYKKLDPQWYAGGENELLGGPPRRLGWCVVVNGDCGECRQPEPTTCTCIIYMLRYTQVYIFIPRSCSRTLYIGTRNILYYNNCYYYYLYVYTRRTLVLSRNHRVPCLRRVYIFLYIMLMFLAVV